MSNPNSHSHTPHIALIPNAGMGHLTPFLRLAAMLVSRNCRVTLITAKPILSIAEANHISFFLSKHPQITHLEFQVLPTDPNAKGDPFFLQYNAIRRSTHLIHPLLTSSPIPFSTIVCDFMVSNSIPRFAKDIGVPCFIFSTTSARFFSFMAHLAVVASDIENGKFDNKSDYLEIPGLAPVPMSSIPKIFLIPNHFIPADVIINFKTFPEATGILMNNFHWFEAETCSALNEGRVLSTLPPVLPIGPLEDYELMKDSTQCLPWLDKQPEESVLYVNFGSRTAMSNDQIRELGNGLERSGCRFLWVLKTNKIDKEDKAETRDLLGESFLERVKDKGLIIKEWVNQQNILAHPSVGGFLSHCGWNSVMEAAQRGVPVLAWPQHGDQRVNAETAEKAGLGIMEQSWGFGLERLVKGEEIARKILELMGDANLRSRVSKVKEEARRATEPGGTSDKAIMEIIGRLS